MKDCIAYKSGYKYQLQADVAFETGFSLLRAIGTPYIRLSPKGRLRIVKGYAWDGASGPAFDTPSFMRGSCIHDALYQLMRSGLLDASVYREGSDKLLHTVCLADGMNRFRAWYVYRSVRVGGRGGVKPEAIKQVIYAPERCRE